MEWKVYAVLGPIASGKGTVIKFLEDKGFYSSSTSDRIREEIKSRGEEVTRESLTRVSNDLRQKFGNDILARRTAEIVDQQGNPNVVIDAIRNPDEAQFLKDKYGMKIIAINARQEKRYEMFKARGNNNAGIENFEQFKDLDEQELTGSLGAHSQRIRDVLKMADVIIQNDGTIEDLQEKVNSAIT